MPEMRNRGRASLVQASPLFQVMEGRNLGPEGRAGNVLGLSLTAGSHKGERNVWPGQRLPLAAVPLTAMTYTSSGAIETAFAPSWPSSSASAGGSGAGDPQVGLLQDPCQTVCSICK